MPRITSRGLTLALLGLSVTNLLGQEPAPEDRSGKMITVSGVVDSGLQRRVAAAARSAAASASVIIFDLQAADSDFGPCYDLAQQISSLGGKVERTVAYIGRQPNGQPIQLTGHAVLVALACDEIVMAEDAKIGDVYRNRPGGGALVEAEAYRVIARRKGHHEWVVLGMVNENLKLVEVFTPNGSRIIDADRLEQLKKEIKPIKPEVVIKEPGTRLLLSAAEAKRLGLIRLTANSRKEVAAAYGLPEKISADDHLREEADRPVLLKISGTIDGQMYQYVARRIKQAMSRGHNVAIVEIDSASGDDTQASSIAGLLRKWNARKIAWVPRQATDAATLVLFGCDELVMARDARIGDVRIDTPSPEVFRRMATDMVNIAQGSKFPEALVRGFVDPQVAVYEVRLRDRPAARSFVTDDELETPENKARFEKARPGPVKEKGVVLKMDGARAADLDFASANAATLDEVKALYDLGDKLPVLEPVWVDSLVHALTSTGGTFLLLVIALTCLYIEVQIPGFGVAGICSAVCFALFFWARYLSDTANSLEIILFLLGMLLLAIELFVLPGFGVVGVGGIALILASLVLASQSFTLPQTEAESWELIRNGSTLLASMVVFMALVVTLARYFPSVPIFNRMVLAPPGGGDEELLAEASGAYETNPSVHADLLGKSGLAVSPLRPAGRMQLGQRFYDVVAGGEFIESGATVEVVEVYPNRIVVRQSHEER